MYGYESKTGKQQTTKTVEYDTSYCDAYEAPCLRFSLTDEARDNISQFAVEPKNKVAAQHAPFASLHKVH